MPDNEDERPAPDLSRTLILAPLRKDALYVSELLGKNGLPAEVCDSSEALEQALEDPPGLVVATHEALGNGMVDVFAAHVREQPDWSELPIVVLLDKKANVAKIHATLSERWPRTRLVFYHRPVATLELLSGIQSLLLARLRQREVRDHIEREVELRRELNHRVKNILASVLSIVSLSKRGNKNFDEMASDLEGRLAALSEVHSAVFRAGGETIDFAAIAATTFAPYRNGHERVSAHGPSITIGRDAGTTLALCLHELATNAIKYGALSVPEGRVAVTWRIEGDDEAEFRLEWVESGGPPVRAPQRAGYGTRYLRAALTSLLGREPVTDFAPDGLRVIVSGPLHRLGAS